MDVYYPNDRAVRADFELQAWATDISSNEGGRVLDFASNGGVNDKNQLIDVCTKIIFTGGPQHAAVNFTQLTDLSFLPGGPMAGYRPAPENTKPFSPTFKFGLFRNLALRKYLPCHRSHEQKQTNLRICARRNRFVRHFSFEFR
ncbi:MAG: hypothetical protein H7318_12325 [Oligoflexus sp.]|nr:hypothetical protein [Oligoflexus sp.]